MKQLIVLIGMLLASHCAIAKKIEPLNIDTIPTKTWSFGLQAGAFTNGSIKTGQLGLFSEFRMSRRFAFEAQLSFQQQSRKSIIDYLYVNDSSLDLAIATKFYFGRKLNWYSKLGVYQKIDIGSELDYYDYGKPGILLGMGRQFLLENKSTLNVETLFRFGKAHGVGLGIKMGYSF